MQSVGEIVRKQDTEYRRGNVQISKYVSYSMHDIIEQCHAYCNSKHITGETDVLGRDKPFANIVIQLRNVWFRATDVDRKNLKFRATTSKEVINAILAKHFVREWMRKNDFGSFLNKWGLKQATYGSAAIKAIENDSGLHISAVDWLQHICDSVDYGPNPKIDVIPLTAGELKRRIKTHGYDAGQVKLLLNAIETRKTLDGQRKDNKSEYIILYEIHAMLSRAQLLAGQYKKSSPTDEDIYVDQVHVISYVGKKEGRGKVEYQDFTLYAGEEDGDPFMLTHLIEEDGRTLAIGPVENAFTAQWMRNHWAKIEKDTLDMANLLVWQTADPSFVGQNMIDSMQSGDILIHAINMPLTKVDTSKTDIANVSNSGATWKMLAAEINGVSEAQLGIMPPSGTSGTQLDSLLRENYSLFQTVTENKGLSIIKLMRWKVLPFIKRRLLNHTDEISVALDEEDVAQIDAMYLKDAAIKKTNTQTMQAINANLDRISQGQPVQPIDTSAMLQNNMSNMQESLDMMGNTRFFKPSEITKKMWSEQLKDFEWDMEIDMTGEGEDMQEVLAAYAQALTAVMTPGFEQNEKAKAFVGKMLEVTGAMNPMQFAGLKSAPAPAAMPTQTVPTPVSTGGV